MMVQISPVGWDSLAALTRRFLDETRHRNDGFWDDGIYQSAPFRILVSQKEAGFFACSPLEEGGTMLHAFYLLPQYRYLAQEIFRDICVSHKSAEAMVASNDELFLCLAMETMHAYGGSFEVQAYNLTYGPPRREAEFGPESVFPVLPEEYSSMHAMSETMWLDDPLVPSARFYRLMQHGETLGFGSIFPRRLDSGLLDVGNYVLPAHRRKGVGRSLLIHMSRMVLAEGKIPCAGCRYYNRPSVRTLASSGFIPQSRIFRIRLTKEGGRIPTD